MAEVGDQLKEEEKKSEKKKKENGLDFRVFPRNKKATFFFILFNSIPNLLSRTKKSPDRFLFLFLQIKTRIIHHLTGYQTRPKTSSNLE